MPPEAAAGAGITLSESAGVRYLHFGTEWVQGAMRLAHPYRLELEYQRQMMAPLVFAPEPADILQLGLGAAALTKFCHRYLPGSRVVAIERSARVIAAARQWFALPADDRRLRVIEADAGRYLRESRGPGAPGVDWLQVDLYDARARGPVLDSAAFYRDCRRVLRAGGVATFNFFGSSLRASLARIREAFGADGLRLPCSAAGNTVVLAFAGAPPGDAALLARRARAVQRRFGWPVSRWIAGAR